jgi:hypothetical protein
MIYRSGTQNAILIALTAASMPAQTNPAEQSPKTGPAIATQIVNTLGIAGGFVSNAGPLRAVTGQPYSAQQETERIQTLADGTHITQPSQKVVYYRDSQGRTRTKRTMPAAPGFPVAVKPPVFIDISDPVAGYRYTLEPNGHTAHRTSFGPSFGPGRGASAAPNPPPPASPPAPGAPVTRNVSQLPRPEISRESLGTRNIEGILAEGTKATTTWPVGLVGNDRPIISVTETWTSRQLGVTVLTITSDPRNGDTTTRLTNISQAEPDPSLFQVPADYQIVDPAALAVR